jgi:predicted HTH transcriptional regulator
VADMAALPPANTPENARQHRSVLMRHNPGLAQTFRELGLI